ncbi:coproporphyrinogen III oxidase, partial [Mycobacterium tuberculosis]|nr:coproporphyrinogen III oxidase [Mycobacterium tuberculosis]
LSTYALVSEAGTGVARPIRRGDLPAPGDDVLADRYVLLDRRLHEAGFDWYEVSNWSRTGAGECRHNLGYWRSDDWWGIGPGAHSHV